MRYVIIAVLALVVLSGCQLDVQGPSMSAKIFYKTENGGDVYKSRGSGMSGGNTYAADGGGMTHSGNASDRFCRSFFNTGAKK